jgi:hypothetical protein
MAVKLNKPTSITCPICRRVVGGREVSADHIIPRSRGGETIPENIRWLCKSCNFQLEHAGECLGAFFCARYVAIGIITTSADNPQKRYRRAIGKVLSNWKLML